MDFPICYYIVKYFGDTPASARRPGQIDVKILIQIWGKATSIYPEHI